MTREEAIHEIEKVFEPAFANYIITALTEGATSSDKEQQPCDDCFTDDEKRMFLTSLAREMKICEQVDIEYPNAKIKLVPIIHSIKEKVLKSSLWEVKADDNRSEFRTK